jgi:hypothetical protein
MFEVRASLCERVCERVTVCVCTVLAAPREQLGADASGIHSVQTGSRARPYQLFVLSHHRHVGASLQEPAVLASGRRCREGVSFMMAPIPAGLWCQV